jgi:sugar phosphate isomerase/epimerase
MCRRTFTIVSVLIPVFLTALITPCFSGDGRFPSSFFAMDTGTGRGKLTAEEQVRIVKELGFGGLSFWPGKPDQGIAPTEEMLGELDRQGLGVAPIYLNARLDEVDPWEPVLPEALKLLSGRPNAMIWLTLQDPGETCGLSSPACDGAAVRIVRRAADLAEASGVRISLYPHTGLWMEKLEDAFRVAEAVNRPSVGITFNLCHWLKVSADYDPNPILERVASRLSVVTINGADKDGDDWNRLIMTLDMGSFDILPLLQKLKSLGFSGPIGLQGYGIPGDVRENLEKSMAKWKSLSRKLNSTSD